MKLGHADINNGSIGVRLLSGAWFQRLEVFCAIDFELDGYKMFVISSSSGSGSSMLSDKGCPGNPLDKRLSIGGKL